MRTRWIAAAVSLISVVCSIAWPGSAPRNTECVVLIHGLARGTWSMKQLEWAFERAGYRVVNLGYKSTRVPVSIVANKVLPAALERAGAFNASKVHFVTHSMGGIIVRQYLKQHPALPLGRVVMIAPPNKGSEVAETLRKTRVGRWILGPAGCSLGNCAGSLPNSLGSANFELGVIAGDRSLNPLFSSRLAGPDDGKVSVASTRLEGMKEHHVVHASHTWLTWRKAVIRPTVQFVETGSFKRETSIPQ